MCERIFRGSQKTMFHYIAFILLTFDFQVYGQSKLKCGQVKYEEETASGLIYNGELSPDGQWPWVVALHEISGPTPKYICSGTLISDEHVLTAAHCIHDKVEKSPRNSNHFSINLGTSDITNSTNGVIRKLTEITLHPDWLPVQGTNYDADLAILKLDIKVEFSRLIQPVCLPNSYQRVFEEIGYTAGYGFSEDNEIGGKLRYLKVPTVTQEKCLFHPSGLFRAASNRTFCGGDLNKSVCKGDSGSGFVIRTPSLNYVIIGIVSATILGRGQTCRPGSYAVFTNVPIFVNWILTETGRRNEINYEIWNPYDPSINFVSRKSIYVEEGDVRTYVARRYYEDKLLLGKFHRPHKVIYIPYWGDEIKFEDGIEILATNRKYQWVPFNGEFPPNSVQGGYEGREKLYVGRRMHEGKMTIGKIVDTHRAIFIPSYWKEHRYDDNFEILIIV